MSFHFKRFIFMILSVQILALLLLIPTSARAELSINDDWYYLKVWERTDWPVGLGATSRSWYWGPAPFAITSEAYAQSPNGVRRVQYWDKSRMEITQPASDRNSKWYVTNGLLVREMVSGKMQMGNNPEESYKYAPANIPVSGDAAEYNSNSPTYASFKDLASLAMDNRFPQNSQPIISVLAKDGSVSTDYSLITQYPETAKAYYEPTLGHNIPGVLWHFMNLNGPVMIDRSLQIQTIENWVFAFGYPITEAYWTRSRVGGVEKDVLVQLFERRALTYTPSNPPGFQVEMGNVGSHYYNWRYSTPYGIAPAYTQPIARLIIPKLGIDTPIEYVGVLPNGNMDVPANPNNVGWYKYGARPGEAGNAVIAGHRDWYNLGKVVFYNLGSLAPGDLIYVQSSLDKRQTFVVTGVSSVPAYGGASESVFGASATPNLNLITCIGDFDPASRSYNNRLIVNSRLVE
ncbi:class F sortase [Candidatus Chlorohelix sp.]|uniref:class F sortase n=1 Tax=Candidatus Chlorohelix sp. TaxID=3139201 RepID=UPI00301F2AD3